MEEVRLARVEDIEQLVQLRIDFLKDEFGLSCDQEAQLRIRLNNYFNRSFITDSLVAVFVFDKNRVVSTAYLSIQERPSNHLSINGLYGTLLNVFTYPAYRRLGYATKAVSRIIEEAQNKEISIIELSATADGLDVYRKLGFKEIDYTAMRLKL